MIDTAPRRWTLTGIGMGVVVVAALVTGLVVATWTQDEPEAPVPATAREDLASRGRAAR